MPKKILIVEDEANIRELLRLYLEREGYAVIEAENGVEGIKLWKSEKPDMLLLDVMMPVMDGWAVCDLCCSTLKEVKKHRAEFLPEIEKYVDMGTEF